MVNESLGGVPVLGQAGEEEMVVGVEQLVKVSRQCRNIMKECQEQLELLAETGLASVSRHYIAQSDLLYKLELIRIYSGGKLSPRLRSVGFLTQIQ